MLVNAEHKASEADMFFFLFSEAAVNLILSYLVKHQVASPGIQSCVKQNDRPVLIAIAFRK